MKLKALLGLSLGLILCSNGQATLVRKEHFKSSAIQSSLKEETEEYVFEEERNMSSKTSWKAADGDFVTVEDWIYSGKGVSFEFKFNDEDISKRHPMLVTFRSQGSNITYTKSGYYIFDIQNGIAVSKNNNIGKLTALSGEDDGWYRLDILFATIGELLGTNASATPEQIGECSHKTVDELFIAPWGGKGTNYWSDLTVRKMKLIDGYESDVDGELNMYSYTGSHAIPSYAKFFQSNKVVYMDFCATHNIRGGFGNNGTTKTDYYYLVNNFSSQERIAEKGKLWDLGEGWFHYEVSASDLGKPDLSDDLNYFNNGSNWGFDGYGFTKLRSFGFNDSYSYNVSVYVNGQLLETTYDNGIIEEPDAPDAPEGKHFSGWFSDADCKNAFDFTQPINSDISLYAGFANHEYEWKFDETKHWKECSCGLKDSSSPEVDHTFNCEIQKDELLKSSKNCEHGYLYYKSCVCGQHNEETFEVGSGDPDLHIPSEPTRVNFVAPTCESDGSYVEKIVCEQCGKTINEHTHTISKLGHNYVEGEWILNEDKQSAKLILICSNDSNHKQEVIATVVATESIPTTTEHEGKILYTMSASFEGKQYGHVVEETIPKLAVKNNKGLIIGLIIGGSVIGLGIIAGVVVFLIKKNKKKPSK